MSDHTDELITTQAKLIEAQAGMIVAQTQASAEYRRIIQRLTQENAELRRRLGGTKGKPTPAPPTGMQA